MRMPLSTNGRTDRFVMRLTEITSPCAATMARLSLEPEFVGYAAVRAARRHVSVARRLVEALRSAANSAKYAQLVSRLHELVAVASGNPLLTELHRILNEVRISGVWPRLKLPQDGPPADYHVFAEHDAIFSAIESRDRRAAHAAMRSHLKSVLAMHLKDD